MSDKTRGQNDSAREPSSGKVLLFRLPDSEIRAKDKASIPQRPPRDLGAESFELSTVNSATDWPSIVVLPFEADTADPGLTLYAANLRARIERLFEQWKWLDVVKAPAGKHRYALKCSLRRTGRSGELIPIKIELRENFRARDVLHLTTEAIEPQIVAIEAPSSADISTELFYERAEKHIFCRVKALLYAREERFANSVAWASSNACQNTFWAYLAWMKATAADNGEARRLATTAINAEGGQDNARAWAMLARTYVEGIAYKWDLEIRRAKTKLHAFAYKALQCDDNDVLALEMVSNSLLYREDVNGAINHAERHFTKVFLFPTAVYSLGLMNSYRGHFENAERILQTAVFESDEDRAIAVGLQYLAQALCLLGRPDEGIETAMRALLINPTSSPALRTLAANLASCGREHEARKKFAEAEKHSPGFTTAAYKDNQPWQPRAYNALNLYIENLHYGARAPSG